jgi:hypothetical protein
MKLIISIVLLTISILSFAQDKDPKALSNLGPGTSVCEDYQSKINPHDKDSEIITINICYYKIKFAESANQLGNVVLSILFNEFIAFPGKSGIHPNSVHPDVVVVRHPDKNVVETALRMLVSNDKLEKITKPIEINVKLEIFSIEDSISQTFKVGLDKLSFGTNSGTPDIGSVGDGTFNVSASIGAAELSAFVGAERIKGNIQKIDTFNIEVNNRESFYHKLQMPVFFEFPSSGKVEVRNQGLNFSAKPSIDSETGAVVLRNFSMNYGILHKEANKDGDMVSNVENIEFSRTKKWLPTNRVKALFSLDAKSTSKSKVWNFLSFSKTKTKSKRKLLILVSAEILSGDKAKGDIDPLLQHSPVLSKDKYDALPESGVTVQEFLNSFKLEKAFKKPNGNARVRYSFDRSLLTKEILNKKVLVKFKGKGVLKEDKKFRYDIEELALRTNYSPEIDLASLKKKYSRVKLVIRERRKVRGAKIKKVLEFNPTTSNAYKSFSFVRERSRKVKKDNSKVSKEN